MKETTAVPAGYQGREQAWIKHLLLENYLEKLLLIVGMGGRRSGEIELCYARLFRWTLGDDTTDIESTSIAISLRTMENCRRCPKGRASTSRCVRFISKGTTVVSPVQHHR